MMMLGIIAYIMWFAVGGAIETVTLATGDVDSIGETVFAQGIGEIPEGFGMTGLYIRWSSEVLAKARRSTLP